MPARSFVRSLQAWHSERTGHPPSPAPTPTSVVLLSGSSRCAPCAVRPPGLLILTFLAMVSLCKKARGRAELS
jgi:hypothetical protein